MAPINDFKDEQLQEFRNFLNSLSATICLLVGMIVSVVGIKIWWFKHRLNFEQTSIQNGGPHTTQAVFRNTLKDKRSSQQVCDSVVAHGVFRRRNEDELEIIERPRQLPPIRVPLRSLSTTALFAKLPELTDAMMPSPTVNANDVNEIATTSSHDEIEETNESQRLFQKKDPKTKRKFVERVMDERRPTGILPLTKTQGYDSSLIEGDEKPVIADVNATEIQNNSKSDAEDQATNYALDTEELHFRDLESADNVDSADGVESNVIKPYINNTNDNDNIFKSEDFEDFKRHQSNWINENSIRPEPIYAVIDSEKQTQQHRSKGLKSDDNDVQDQTSKQAETGALPNKVDNLEYEFRKEKRQSNQEHEGYFWELSETSHHERSPSGFGKSIDEDWENFENLTPSIGTPISTSISQETDVTEFQTNFQLNELETVAVSHSHTSPINTTYVQSIEELYDELTDNDEDSINNIIITKTANQNPKSSILKERLRVLANSNYEVLSGTAHKLKAQQKVTFDSHTEEYYLPESDSDSINEGNNLVNEYNFDKGVKEEEKKEKESPEVPNIAIPIPMQRTANTENTSKKASDMSTWNHNFVNVEPPNRLGTNSNEETDTFNTIETNWTTINQEHNHYQINENKDEAIKPMPRESSNRPANRRTFEDQENTQTSFKPAPIPRRKSTEA